MEAYLKRLSYLMDLEADGDTQADPPRGSDYLADYPEFLRSLLDGSAGNSYQLTEPVDGKLKLVAVDLPKFQALVQEIRAYEGRGYKVHMTHTSGGSPGEMVDTVVLRLT